ncbi:hypothetical protein SKUN_001760 (plasmid) [Spiroplasma kunkelii CR2-3x]|uniref:Uncharacterized protein n=1 Tax=Spiroplasma kunkelii CR2-3x TaxID=273035 RepID=A0A0K2JK15_SPIKU|nr:hypothetical protein [Spiroplasma kunkelii]ALA98611.1 hypothetical protein SKUN_001760 [Spiroplasma kunkelii CR2-3x]
MALNANQLKLNKEQQQLLNQRINLARNKGINKGSIKEKKKSRLKVFITFFATLLLCTGGFVGGYYGVQYSQNHNKNVVNKIATKELGEITIPKDDKTPNINQILVALYGKNTSINIKDYAVKDIKDTSAVIYSAYMFDNSTITVTYTVKNAG